MNPPASGPAPLAHGVGSSSDLPLPLDLVLQAGAATVVLSFLIAAVLWTRPRLGGGTVRAVRTAGWLPVLRLVVLLLAVYLVGDALAGPGEDENPAARALFVWLWVGIIPVSVIFGPVWRAVNPLRTLFRLLRLPRAGLRPRPASGAWPAAGWLLAFVWFELVAPHRTEPAVIGGCLLGYGIVQLGMAAVRGEEWFGRGDCFEVYSELAGRLSPVRWRRPLTGLAAPLPVTRGLAAFVAVWWGSTIFDSASGSPVWAGFVQRAGHGAVLATGALLLVCSGVLLAVRRIAGKWDVTASLIPIAVGYTLAHYLSLLIVEGPRGFLQLIHQWGMGGGPAGNVAPIPGVIAGAQVALILAGHVLGVIVAHDAAQVAGSVAPVAVGSGAPAGAPGGGSVVSGGPVAAGAVAGRAALGTLADEFPLVLFMIGCTWAGLFLLFVR
ncbi:hypothetical protein ACWT_5421 [Actinoplanes sp. SE50]|uniref:hypothetical protein n=1 Tax=unclassified Actinoplanes TaxID=2626549 RepID=UPI00023EC69D|nr:MULTISPECIES: hypothetical protein [unclassified Actinoplanes]AEV86438.1 hypothetical protein ACPL_5551 [Actinoplanes sp. SE50/110]ATO84836.1 hypothetical protein ACWT_5421 [Actinoplanes sp. SE50]SLM02245.1 hypothetical protein ACSP50_5484 [Actinoplanes sp. SE50/110]